MRILLLYNGYPRLSQTYQIDEAKELAKKHEIMIISWCWELFTVDSSALPYFNDHPLSNANLTRIKKFRPDVIHSHFLDNVDLAYYLASLFHVKFSIRTHSFDILTTKNNLLENKSIIQKINSSFCAFMIVFPEFKQRCLQKNITSQKLLINYPQINISRFQNVFSLENGKDIMSGGAFLPKKDIKNFILIAKQIKELYPTKTIRYYSVKEDPAYYNEIMEYNRKNGSPVEFLTKQPNEMPIEYKKHEWLIYSACPTLRTVGLPLMIAEAQASGVGVITFKLRDSLCDYISENGYFYETTNDILNIIDKPFEQEKKVNAFYLSSRYNIENNIEEMEKSWMKEKIEI